MRNSSRLRAIFADAPAPRTARDRVISANVLGRIEKRHGDHDGALPPELSQMRAPRRAPQPDMLRSYLCFIVFLLRSSLFNVTNPAQAPIGNPVDATVFQRNRSCVSSADDLRQAATVRMQAARRQCRAGGLMTQSTAGIAPSAATPSPSLTVRHAISHLGSNTWALFLCLSHYCCVAITDVLS